MRYPRRRCSENRRAYPTTKLYLPDVICSDMEPEQLQKQFDQLQREHQLILDRIDDAIALFDKSDRLISFNRQFGEIWGLSPEYLQTLPDFHQICTVLTEKGSCSHATCQLLQQIWEQSRSQPISMEIEPTHQRYLEVNTTHSEDGSILFVFRDVTEHRQSQNSLNAEVKRLRFLLGLMERLQTPVEELREVAQFALNYLVEAMGAAFGDVKVISGEGKNRYARSLSNRVSGEFIAYYGEPAVAQMENTLKEGIPYGQGLLWQVVSSGQPLFVEEYHKHPQAVEMFRHPGIGQLGIFPIPNAQGEIIGVLTLESRNLNKLQEAPQQDMLVAACRTLGSAIERAQAQDQLRRINQNLERASQMKSEFLASMSHELRTPLNSIIGFSQLLESQRSGPLSEKQRHQLQAIAKSGNHLLELLNDILDLSKVESGKMELELTLVNLEDLCDQCLTTIQPRAQMKNLHLSQNIEASLPLVSLDPRRIRQILINLLSNAVKFTPEEGNIELAAYLAKGKRIYKDLRPDESTINPEKDYLCLQVSDSGIGIPESKWHLLFQPFQQVDASLSRQHEGTGLGLSLTRRLAELHGGTVSFQSQEKIGSTFRVWLPLNPSTSSGNEQAVLGERQMAGESTEEPIAATVGNENRRCILIVEDQPLNQMFISEVLETEGYAVEIIEDGETMQNTIETRPTDSYPSLPDVVLMDIQLPRIHGFSLIQKMRSHPQWQSIPIIAMTALAMPGDENRCLQAGANAYLSKPLTISTLLDTLNNFAPPPASHPGETE